MPRNGTPGSPAAPGRLAQAGALEGRGAGPEGAHPGQDHPGRPVHLCRARPPGGPARRGAPGPSRPSAGCRCRSRGRRWCRRRRSRPAHRAPLVEGMPPPSTRTASRRARATPLKVASTMWWVFLPSLQPHVQGDARGGDEGPPELLGQLRGRRAASRAPASRGRRGRRRRGRGGPRGRGPPRPAPRRGGAAPRRTAAPRPCRRGPRPGTRPARCRRPRPCGGRRRPGPPRPATTRSKPPWRPSCSSMWSKKGRPVETSTAPVPSMSTETLDRGLLGGALALGPPDPSLVICCVLSSRRPQTPPEGLQEPVVLGGGAHRDPQAPGQAVPARTVSHQDAGRPGGPATPSPPRARSGGRG